MSTPKSVIELAKKSGAKMVDFKFVDTFGTWQHFSVPIGELTEEHWRVIRFLRSYYLQFNTAPMIRKLCKDTQTDLKKIYELFPSGPAKGACKIAGLPKPTGCA